MADNILVFCAHSDDQIFGPGATLARYASEGCNIHTVIFSYGESSHPHLKEQVTVKMRVKEAKEADKVIGGKGVMFLGLDEGKFKEQFNAKGLESRMKNMILEKNPSKIFTHSDEDPHPDHRAVAEIVLAMADQIHNENNERRYEVYGFDVWGFNIKKTRLPKLYIDVSRHFSKKIDALKKFPSQWMSLVSLMWTVYTRAISAGIKMKARFAERFYKMR